ncbi:MAG: hypothetical protein LQ342_007485 [Letrouitia transgressa]|nr:MAG: hypothetical protein LQ342_007485 [Letrouitia transgressa]
MPLKPYATNIPDQNNIPRLRTLSTECFTTHWANKPFILTDVVHEWPAFHEWSIPFLLQQFCGVEFRAEAVDWPLDTCIDYMNSNEDESPLYLFDKSFVEKMGLREGKGQDGHYWVPECFAEDLFAVLGEQRPDSRWLIMGPERSGSTFHKDPNATSAWNAVLRGSKYWIMFPSSTSYPAPPGVFVSENQSEVTTPLSIVEWLSGFHAEARKTRGCMEGICKEGELVYVPSGWWHLVVNLSPSIAITQNFVPSAHLAKVLSFLKNKPDQVSGFSSSVKNPYETFTTKMKGRYPELLEAGLKETNNKREPRKRKWDQVIKGQARNGEIMAGFSFDFSEDVR